MTDITLYHMPGACSRVTMNALEEIGLGYDDHVVNIMVGEQKSDAYLAVNPKAKVPALKIGARVLTENAAILHWLDRSYPAAGLLPAEGGEIDLNEPLEHLVWCSSTLHPLVRQIRMPARFTDGDTSGVNANGIAGFSAALDRIAPRLDDRWWYGDRWSILDVYLFWLYNLAGTVEAFDLGRWPALAGHAARVAARPSFVRAAAREQKAMAAAGVVLP